MASSDSTTRLVLLVEDNQDDADFVREMLAEGGRHRYEIHHAPCLTAALEWLASSKPDAILLDLGLPESSGVPTVISLRDGAGEIPIVVLTGADDEVLAASCIDEGAQDYLWKGEFRSSSLRRAIGNAIARARMAAEQKRLQHQLEVTLAKVLTGFISICAHCKRIKEQGGWHRVEDYFGRHSEAVFSHGICPECAAIFFPNSRILGQDSVLPPGDPPPGS